MTRTLRLRLLITAGATLLVAAVIAIVVLIQVSTPAGVTSTSPTVPSDLAADARALDDIERPELTVVEFLDFECEACGAMHPVVEQLREQYDGRVAFRVRYFPLPGHRNSTNAAMAVEAAALQGRFEDMYDRLFESQAEWGESSESMAERFRDDAEAIGLDLDRYDADVASDSVRARVERDVALGQALGVAATPTFFLDGEPLQLQYSTDLQEAIDRALAA